MAEVKHDLNLNTLEGGVITVQVTPTNTIQDLKAMLIELKHEDPIERKLLKVDVLAEGALVDSDETLEAAGLLCAESEVTALYSRIREVEAASKEAIHAEGLVQVRIPSSQTEISEEAFEGCDQVVKVVIPETVTVIQSNAFAGCKSLVSVTIPDSVTKIEAAAFMGCTSLTRINIPASVTSIGGAAFTCCALMPKIPKTVTSGPYGPCPLFRLAAAEDLQDLELPEEVPVDSAASLALEWWDRWLRSILSNPAGWFFCREALRQALAWQRWARRKKLREEVAKAAAVKVLNAVVERLGIGLDQVEVPTQLLLELLELEESGLEKKLAEELTRRIQASLCEGPVVPMSTAVALANGDTPIPCGRGSLLWSGLVASIAAQLKSKRQVDDFGACRPCPDLWDDVAQLKAGSWQSLELKLRRPFS
eukprot:symbB.v1.2.032135.t1/scaffold3816.1/size52752/2